MATQDYGLARRMCHRLAARGPVAITDDDLFEVLGWVANGILDDSPPRRPRCPADDTARRIASGRADHASAGPLPPGSS